MSKKVTLPLKLVKQLVDPIFVKSIRDKTFISDALMNMLGDSNLEFFLDLISREDYTPVTQGCHVKFKLPKYKLDEYNKDILIDMGLYDNGYVYGEVLEDDSYSSDFDPYHYKMKVNVLMHTLDHTVDTGILIRGVPESIDTKDLIVIDKLSIKHYQLNNIDEVTL
jgi:hypothetical protein